MRTEILAQVTGGRAIIEDSIQQIQNVQEAWDQRWLDIFGGANGLYEGINKFAAMIVVSAFIFFAVTWVKEAMERGIFPALPHVLWVLVVFVLLYNNGKMLGSITLAIRNIINDQTQVVLEVQIGEVSMLEALNDVIVSQQAKTLIQQQYAECEAKEGKAQVDCFLEAGKRASDVIDQEYRAKGWFTAGVERLKAHIDAVGQRIMKATQNSENPDLSGFVGQLVQESLLSTAGQAAAQAILKGFQWAFSNILELSMLLTGLIGPLAVAGSIMPLPSRPIWAWLIGFFSLGLAKFSYNIIVGLAATVVVAAEAQSSSDIGFLLLISVLAPVLALALAGGGGMAVFRGASGGVTRIISIGTSFLPIK
jgi:nitrate reductase NapE component